MKGYCVPVPHNRVWINCLKLASRPKCMCHELGSGRQTAEAARKYNRDPKICYPNLALHGGWRQTEYEPPCKCGWKPFWAT